MIPNMALKAPQKGLAEPVTISGSGRPPMVTVQAKMGAGVDESNPLRREIEATEKRYYVIDEHENVIQNAIVIEKWKPPRPARPKNPHTNFDKDWSVVFLEELKAVAVRGELTGADYRVLHYLISELGFENECKNLNQAEVARQLRMLRQHVNRSIRRLTEEGILVEGPLVGRGHLYSLNPCFGWRGDGAKHKSAKKNAPPIRPTHLRAVPNPNRERNLEAEAEDAKKARESASVLTAIDAPTLF